MSPGPRPKKLLEQVSEAIRRKHDSPRTEETYARWIKRFILPAKQSEALTSL